MRENDYIYTHMCIYIYIHTEDRGSNSQHPHSRQGQDRRAERERERERMIIYIHTYIYIYIYIHTYRIEGATQSALTDAKGKIEEQRERIIDLEAKLMREEARNIVNNSNAESTLCRSLRTEIEAKNVSVHMHACIHVYRSRNQA